MFSFKFREMLYHISGIIQIKEKPAHITVCKIDDKVYKKSSVFFSASSLCFPPCGTFVRSIPWQQPLHDLLIG